jgi:peptidyl-prolyl cis-trans isomerase SurA
MKIHGFHRWLAKTIYLVLVIIPALGLAAEAANRPSDVISDIDWVLVVVNDDIITQSELSARLANAKKRLKSSNITAPPDDVLKMQVLERMVLERIQLQLAKRTGIKVSNEKIEESLALIAEKNNMSLDVFYRTMTTEGIEPNNFKEQLREQIIIKQLVERDINNRISISENEVETFLENQAGSQNTSQSFRLSHIMIPASGDASSEIVRKAKKRIEEIQARLEQGVEFAQTAVRYSQGPNALSGGDLGWKQAGQLPELFLTAVKDLESGEITDVLRSSNGFHILKLNDKRGGSQQKSVTQTHARHILLKLSEILTENEARIRLIQLKTRIENGEDFAALAKAYSEDTASAMTGGELGWINPGGMIPEFEQAMDGLRPNEISQPIETDFGLHLIQVLERRKQDISDEIDRAGAR